MLEATRVRSLIGGGAPWYEEYRALRHAAGAGVFQGSIGRRAAVLVTLLAAAAVLAGGAPGRLAAGPAAGWSSTFLLALAVMTFTPDEVDPALRRPRGLGAAVLVLGARPGRRGASGRGRRRWPGGRRRRGAGAGRLQPLAVRVGAGSPRRSPRCRRRSSGSPLATLLLVGGRGGRLSARLAVLGAGADTAARAAVLAAGAVVVCWSACWRCRCWRLARVAVAHRDSYTLASDARRHARRRPVRAAAHPLGGDRPGRGPAAATGGRGTVPPGSAPTAAHPVPSTSAACTLPGFVVAGRSPPAWFTLDPQQRDGGCRSSSRRSARCAPATTCGSSSDRRAAERRRSPGDAGRHPAIAPAGAKAVRLVSTRARGRHGPRSTLPRVPRLTPMDQVLPPGTRAILDWPVAFLFPCLAPGRCRRAARRGAVAAGPRPGPGGRASPTRPASAARSPRPGCWSRAADADLPRGRPDRATPSGSTAGPRSAAGHAAAGGHRAHGDRLDLGRARPRAGPRPGRLRMGAMLGLSDTATQTERSRPPGGPDRRAARAVRRPVPLVPEDLYARSSAAQRVASGTAWSSARPPPSPRTPTSAGSTPPTGSAGQRRRRSRWSSSLAAPGGCG